MSAIAICIPAFNSRPFLEEGLCAIKNQSFNDWELIVTEDGTNDGTFQLVKEFAQSLSNGVKYLRHETNRGPNAARNTAISSSTSELIALLDSDDLWDKDHLAICFETLKLSGAQLVFAGSTLFGEEGSQSSRKFRPTEQDLRNFPSSIFAQSFTIQPSSVLMQRSLWESVGGLNERYRHCEDKEMWLRCARFGAQFAFTGRDTCFYRKHDGAASTQTYKMAVGNARVLDQYLDWEAIPRGVRKTVTSNAWGAAGRIIRRTDPKRALEHFQRAKRINPLSTWFLWTALMEIIVTFKR